MAKTTEKVVELILDQKLIEESQELFEELGLDMESAIRLFLKQSVNIGGIPFKLRRSRNSSDFQKNRNPRRAKQTDENKEQKDQVRKNTKPIIEASDAIINDL